MAAHAEERAQIADLLLANHAHLVDEWERRVRERSPIAALPGPLLRDEVPEMLNQVVHGLRLGEERPEEIEHTASNHGRQRIDLGYDMEQVIREFNIARACILEFLESRQFRLSPAVGLTIHAVIDNAIAYSAKGFMLQHEQDLLARRKEDLAFISHDLRTPLAAIAASARALDIAVDRQELTQATELLAGIRRNIARLDALLLRLVLNESTLATSAVAAVQPVALHLRPLAEACIQRLSPLALPGATAIANQVPEDIAVEADSEALSRILENLISNAIDHAPGGRVSVEARPVAPDKVEIAVRDNGKGMDAAIMERIFDIRAQSGSNPTGTGLGLAIVKKLVEAHGGTIEVDSTPGQGAVFRFTLPAVRPNA